MADALSRMYSGDSLGTERARSEFTCHDVVDDDTVLLTTVTDEIPVLAGIEARVVTRRGSRERRPSRRAVMAGLESSQDFAVRMKDRFVLRGPRNPVERTEGGRINSSIPAPVDTDTPVDADTPVPDAPAPVDTPDPVGASLADGSGLLSIVAQSTQGVDLLTVLRGRYGSDSAFSSILARPHDFRNFELEDQLIYLKRPGGRVLCIPKISIQGRNVRELIISEAHSMLAHLGASKTLDYLRDHVWWKDLVSDVRAFCETCYTCKISKPTNQKPYGLLNPLAIPSYPWESIGMDFVGPLPES